jgi:hypothetical protein
MVHFSGIQMTVSGSNAQKPGAPITEGNPIGDSTTHSHPQEIGGAQPVSTSPASGSRFDPKRYRQANNVQPVDGEAHTTKIQTVIPVRKPSRKQFIFAKPSPDFRVDNLPTLQDEVTGDIYLLAADLEFPADVENKIDYLNLATAITVDGSLFLWFYKNSTNSWSQSARIAIREASRQWVRVIPDKSSNGYIIELPKVAPAPPTWPNYTFPEILEIAFGARYIDSLEHPLVKKLRGDFNA